MKTNEKSFSNPVNWSLLIAALMLLILQGCKCHRPPIVEIKSSIKAPQGIAFIDVNDAVPKNVHNVKITLIDPEKKVLSSNGIAFETVELAEGVMSVGLSPNAQFSAERPYRFSVRAEAEGYMTTVRSIVITDSTPNYTPIYMAKLDSLPSNGLAASVGNVTAVSGGTVTQNLILGTKLSQGNDDSILVKIPAGTQLFHGKEPVQTKGPLSYRILFGKPRDRNANLVFPGGFEVTDAVNKNDENIADAAHPIFFTTAGWLSIEMNIGNTSIDRFSDSLDIEIPITDTITNPTTQSVLKAGDTIPIWSLDNHTGTWRRESTAEIMSSVNRGLKAKIKIIHLSTVNFDFWTGGCTSEILVDFHTTEFNGLHLTDYINNADNSIVKRKIIDFSDIIPPQTTANPLHVLRAPDLIGKLLVHETQDPTSAPIGESTPLSCTSTGNCTNDVPGNCLAPVGSPISPGTTLHFVSELSTTASPKYLCSNSVWLKNTGTGVGLYNTGVSNSLGNVTIPQSLSTGPKDIFLWYVKNPNTSPESISLRLHVDFDADGDVKIYRGNSASVIGTGHSTRTPTTGTATEIEIRIPDGGALGSVIIDRWCN